MQRFPRASKDSQPAAASGRAPRAALPPSPELPLRVWPLCTSLGELPKDRHFMHFGLRVGGLVDSRPKRARRAPRCAGLARRSKLPLRLPPSVAPRHRPSASPSFAERTHYTEVVDELLLKSCPWRSRRDSEVVQKLPNKSNRCRTDSPGAETRPNFGQNWPFGAALWPNWTSLGQASTKTDQSCSIRTNCLSSWVSNVSQTWPNMVESKSRCWSDLAHFENSAQIAQNVAPHGQFWPTLGRWLAGQVFDNCWTTVRPLQGNFGDRRDRKG